MIGTIDMPSLEGFVLALPREAKLRLRDSLSADLADTVLPAAVEEAVLEEVERRDAELIADPSQARSWKQIQAALRQSRAG